MENSVVSSPICATSPSAKASDRLRNGPCRHKGPGGAATGRAAGGPAAPSGCSPIAAGVDPSQRPASTQPAAATSSATQTEAPANPQAAISAAQNGVNSTPPKLAPLKAMDSAAPRRRSNQGATMALIATPLVSAQPSAVSSAAGTICQGAVAWPQARAPAAQASSPARVTATSPNRRCSAGSRVTIAPLARKCRVIAAEIRESGQPSRACRACR